jgi:hypothetical protein
MNFLICSQQYFYSVTSQNGQIAKMVKFFIWPMGLYRPLDGVTNLKYKLLYFLTPNKKNFKEKGTSF